MNQLGNRIYVFWPTVYSCVAELAAKWRTLFRRRARTWRPWI